MVSPILGLCFTESFHMKIIFFSIACSAPARPSTTQTQRRSAGRKFKRCFSGVCVQLIFPDCHLLCVPVIWAKAHIKRINTIRGAIISVVQLCKKIRLFYSESLAMSCKYKSTQRRLPISLVWRFDTLDQMDRLGSTTKQVRLP